VIVQPTELGRLAQKALTDLQGVTVPSNAVDADVTLRDNLTPSAPPPSQWLPSTRRGGDGDGNFWTQFEAMASAYGQAKSAVTAIERH